MRPRTISAVAALTAAAAVAYRQWADRRRLARRLADTQLERLAVLRQNDHLSEQAHRAAVLDDANEVIDRAWAAQEGRSDDDD